MGMKITRGSAFVSVEKIDGFGKNPGLWIGTKYPNQMVEVALFGNEDDAKLFEKWLKYIIGTSSEGVEWE